MKAARALLDWSQEDLANAAQLSVATIRKLELGHISPRDSTMRLIRQAIESAGIEFMDADGVRRCFEDISVFTVPNGMSQLFDDIKQTVQKNGGHIAIMASSMDDLREVFGRNFEKMDELFNQASSVSIQCLITKAEPELEIIQGANIRSISRKYVDTISFCVYGDKYAPFPTTSGAWTKIVSVKSSAMADAFRAQFASLWDKTMPTQTPVHAKGRQSKKKSGK